MISCFGDLVPAPELRYRTEDGADRASSISRPFLPSDDCHAWVPVVQERLAPHRSQVCSSASSSLHRMHMHISSYRCLDTDRRLLGFPRDRDSCDQTNCRPNDERHSTIIHRPALASRRAVRVLACKAHATGPLKGCLKNVGRISARSHSQSMIMSPPMRHDAGDNGVAVKRATYAGERNC